VIVSDTYFTIVFKNLTKEERIELLERYAYAGKTSASSYSHALDDRDEVLKAFEYAEAALSDIGDADRESGDDLAWCENRAAEALPLVRNHLRAHGRKVGTLTRK
jgi:hypothetical protein